MDTNAYLVARPLSPGAPIVIREQRPLTFARISEPDRDAGPHANGRIIFVASQASRVSTGIATSGPNRLSPTP